MTSLTAILFYFLRDRPELDQLTTDRDAPAGLQKIARLPGSISESSGVEFLTQKKQYITHNDAGNKASLYQLDAKGTIVETYKLNVPNVDWEDLTRDDDGNLYIADTGNNDNRRKELAIYKVSVDDMTQAEAIRFVYEDQKEFPPAKKDRNFDSEALFWHDGQLYVVTKDRGQGKNANIYTVPDKPGTYKAKLVGTARINGQVTGAAISPDGNLVAVLEEEKIHLFFDFDNVATFYKGTTRELNLTGAGQTEAVAFEDNGSLIITSEGGSLYRYNINLK